MISPNTSSLNQTRSWSNQLPLAGLASSHVFSWVVAGLFVSSPTSSDLSARKFEQIKTPV